MRSKLVQGTKSITCEKRVRPKYMAVPRSKNQNRVRSYRRTPIRVQVDTKKNTPETLILQRYLTKSPALNRTVMNPVPNIERRMRSGGLRRAIGSGHWNYK